MEEYDEIRQTRFDGRTLTTEVCTLWHAKPLSWRAPENVSAAESATRGVTCIVLVAVRTPHDARCRPVLVIVYQKMCQMGPWKT